MLTNDVSCVFLTFYQQEAYTWPYAYQWENVLQVFALKFPASYTDSHQADLMAPSCSNETCTGLPVFVSFFLLNS